MGEHIITDIINSMHTYAYIIFYFHTKSFVRVQNSLFTYKIVCMSTISYVRIHI